MTHHTSRLNPRRNSPRCRCLLVSYREDGARIAFWIRLLITTPRAAETRPVLSFPSRIGLVGTTAAAARADLPKPLPAGGREHFVEPDELAIYGWINPTKVPDEVKRERHRMVAFQTIRYGIHHYLDDIWQEWQLAVHQRLLTVSPLPVEQREFFTFGIARNLCRSYHRKDQRMIPLLDSSGAPEEGAAGIREADLAARRSDRPAGPINKFSEPAFNPGEWDHGDGLKECINGLRPRAQGILRKTYLDGRSSFEVATEIGLSAENVRQQLRRARDELRRCLEARAGRQKGKDWKHAHLDK